MSTSRTQSVDPPPARAQQRRFWDASSVTGSSYERVDCSVACVLTRFQLRSVWSLFSFYRAFRRVRRHARVDGLLKTAFLVGGPRTCYTLSLWRDDRAIAEFGKLKAHVDAANSAFRPTFRSDLQRPEIFSVQLRLWGLSHNLNWEGLDLRAVVAEELGCPASEVATTSALRKGVAGAR